MFRTFTVICLAFVLAACFPAVSLSQTILIDDFNDGDAEGFEETDFTGGLGVFDASSGAYHLYLTEPVAVTDSSLGTLDADWEKGEGDPRYANGTLRATIRANTYGTTIGIMLRDDHDTESDYGFYGSTSFGTFYIERFEFFANPEAPQTILAMADPDVFPFEVGEDWNIEGRVIGHKLELRAWKVGDARPAKPMLSVTDKVLGPAPGSTIGTVLFFDPVPLMAQGVTEVQVDGTVDNITYTPGRAR